MTGLSESIQAAIKASLPEATAGELKAYITKSEIMAGDLRVAKDVMQKQATQIKDLQEKVEQAGDIEAKAAGVLAEAQKLLQRDRELDKREAWLKSEIALAELEGVKGTMAAFLKVPEIRTSIQRTVGVPVSGGGNSGNGSYTTPGLVIPTPETETITQSPQ